MAPTTRHDQPIARLIDLTRLASRAGRPLTGVDRVEWAYLSELLARDTALYALVRTPAGYLLLDRTGAKEARDRLAAQDFGAPAGLGLLGTNRPRPVRALESRLRRRAIGRCLRAGLARMLRQNLPAGTAYLNLSHTNLTDRVCRAVWSLPASRISVFLHDTIPLDHPELQRPESVPRFRAHLQRAGAADIILTSSRSAAGDIRRHLPHGAEPIIAPLGVVPAAFAPSDLPRKLSEPYFVAVGTIEPRKNLGLLLDVWDELGPNAPILYLIGGRGWESNATFRRIDAAAPKVVELGPVPDAAAAAVVAGARALLFPSLAEGYGLPPLEAAALGTQPVCSDLEVCRELLGESGIYLPTTDVYAWIKEIRRLTEQTSPFVPKAPPLWTDHFKVALSVT